MTKAVELVAVDIVADGRRPQRIVADSAQDGAARRAHDAQRQHDADEIAECQQCVERPVGVEFKDREAEIENRRRHAGQPVFAAREVRQRIELDEIEHLGDRHCDHREIDAGTSERYQSD